MYSRAEKYLTVMCGLDRNTKLSQKTKENAIMVRDSLFHGTTTDFVIMPFDKSAISGDVFEFENIKIKCNALSKIDYNSICAGCAFMFHSPMPDLSKLPISNIFLADSWETCFVDAGRDELRERILKEYSEIHSGEYYITDTLAPGMSGMSSSSVRAFFEFMNFNSIGLKLLDSGMMTPVKSFVGIFLVLDRKYVTAQANCSECISNHIGCEYCKNYAERYM